MFNIDEFCNDCKTLFETQQLKAFSCEIKPTTVLVHYDQLVFIEPLAGTRYERAKQLLLGELVKRCLPFARSTEGVTLKLSFRAGGEFIYALL